MVRGPRFEVIPLPGIEEEVVRHLPPDATVTITASPRRGPAPTLELATRLALRGREVVPHLAARQVRDTAELERILRDLGSAGVREVFVVAGDGDKPVGDFASALDLLLAMEAVGHELTVGIAGYPETHPKLIDDVTVQAMWDKQAHADYIVSQLCFDARVLLEWVRRIRRRGVALPVRIGVAGPVSVGRLLRVGARVGVGESLGVLGRHRGVLRQLPGTWQPGRLLSDLAPAFADAGYRLAGLHVYTFNAVEDTARWWQEVATGHPGRSVDGALDRSRRS